MGFESDLRVSRIWGRVERWGAKSVKARAAVFLGVPELGCHLGRFDVKGQGLGRWEVGLGVAREEVNLEAGAGST